MSTNPVLSEKIRHYRKMFGMTQEEFAAEIGVEPLHISNIERGKKGMSLDMLMHVCRHFNINMSDLLPINESQGNELKARLIAEIVEVLETLELSQVGLIKTMVCSLKD